MPKKHTPSNKVRKRRGKDVDEILEAIAGGTGEQKRARLAAAYDDDLPGGGQHYCVQCDRHFVDAPTLAKHSVGKG
jgi:bud site selection protein 20